MDAVGGLRWRGPAICADENRLGVGAALGTGALGIRRATAGSRGKAAVKLLQGGYPVGSSGVVEWDGPALGGGWGKRGGRRVGLKEEGRESKRKGSPPGLVCLIRG